MSGYPDQSARQLVLWRPAAACTPGPPPSTAGHRRRIRLETLAGQPVELDDQQHMQVELGMMVKC